MAAQQQDVAHLIGAYGLFWQRDEVNWNPGHRREWQLLGKFGRNKPNLQVCDFRRIQGFYLLFNDYGPTYVGLARGAQGVGARLKSHRHDIKKDWTRFCWFAIDDVQATSLDGWSEIVNREAIENAPGEMVLGELEALLIAVLGSKQQNQMKFRAGTKWEQVTIADCQAKGALSKVDPSGLKDYDLKKALAELADS